MSCQDYYRYLQQTAFTAKHIQHMIKLKAQEELRLELHKVSDQIMKDRIEIFSDLAKK